MNVSKEADAVFIRELQRQIRFALYPHHDSRFRSHNAPGPFPSTPHPEPRPRALESVSQLWLFQIASSTSSYIQHAADVLDYGSASSFLLHLANII